MIWITGCKGMLGAELSTYLEERGVATVGTDKELDILDRGALAAFAVGKPIAWIVNCAAYTAVDKAEDEEPLALRLNAEGPGNLAGLAASIGSRLMHISTDYVFSGDKDSPYLESDAASPTGAYGRTKAEGERRVMAASRDAVIVRTAWLYGKHGPNFVYTMLRLMRERDGVSVVSDQYGSPTWARDLASAIHAMVTTPGTPAGTYHFTDEGRTSWHEFAMRIYAEARDLGLLEKDCAVNPIATAAYPTKATRPAYSVLSKEKIKGIGVTVPRWQDSLRDFLTELSTSTASDRRMYA